MIEFFRNAYMIASQTEKNQRLNRGCRRPQSHFIGASRFIQQGWSVRYIRAEAVEAAASAVAEGAIPLAGGTILVPAIARYEHQAQTVVDIGRLAELSRIETASSSLLLGSTV